MGLRKLLGLDRRRLARHSLAIDVEFHVLDAASQKPLTRRSHGRLTNVSIRGACLQTNKTMIDGYHLMLNDDGEDGTPVIIEIPPLPNGSPLLLKAKVLWYNKVPRECQFQFNVGLKFLDLPPSEWKQLEDLIKSSPGNPST